MDGLMSEQRFGSFKTKFQFLKKVLSSLSKSKSRFTVGRVRNKPKGKEQVGGRGD